MSITSDIHLRFHEDLTRQYPKLLQTIHGLQSASESINLDVLSDGLRQSFSDTQQNLKTFFSGIVSESPSFLSSQAASLLKLESQIRERISNIEDIYERLSGSDVNMSLPPSVLTWDHNKVEEQLTGKTNPSDISPRLDDARRVYSNIIQWLDSHESESSSSVYGEIEALRAILFDFIREMSNTLSGLESGMTQGQSGYWRWSNMDGSYTGGSTEIIKEDAVSDSYDTLVSTIESLELELKSLSPTQISEIGSLSLQLKKLNERRYMMGAMLGLQNEKSSVQTQINKKRKLIESQSSVVDDITPSKYLKSEYKRSKKSAQEVRENFTIGLIGADEAQKQIAAINKALEGMGLKPVEIDIDISKKDVKTLKSLASVDLTNMESWEKTFKAISSLSSETAKGFAIAGESCMALGSALQSLSKDSAAAKAGMILAAIGQLCLSFAQALMSCSTWVEWLAFGISGAATLATLVATISGYATGGIVPGTSYSGDKVMARVNSGEMILTTQQQSRLWAIANGASVYGQALATTADAAGVKSSDVKAELQRLQGLALEGQRETMQQMRLRVKGRDLVSATANETRMAAKSGRKSNIRI